jgi:hypothetical protein
MKFRRGSIRGGSLLLGSLVLAAGVVGAPPPATARVVVGIGVPLDWYGPPVVYGPPAYYPPAYIAPPPPVYVAPPVQYVPPPVQSAPPAPQYWYYCNRPQGYYPYVAACPEGWRQVQPTPTQ